MVERDTLVVVGGGLLVVAGLVSARMTQLSGLARGLANPGARTVEVGGVEYDNPINPGQTSFSEVGIDPEEYLPDREGAPAPSDPSAPLPQPGDSQEFGTAPEAEEDDVNDRGNMSDRVASIFDRLANYDDPENLP